MVGDELESKSTKVSREIIRRFSKHSSVFYLTVAGLLTIFQFNVFADNIPKGYIINIVIVVALAAFISNMVERALGKKDESKPFLYCPECINAKMRTTGIWICEVCQKEFGEPKTI